MRENKIKKNVIVRNKINNLLYKIVEVSNDIATAALINDDNTVNETETVAITAKNAIAFRCVEDPNIPDVPVGYSVKSGVLLKDGAPATEQGSLVVSRIIAAVPGRLLLTVEPKEPREGYIDLMSYTVEDDKFKKLIRASIPDVEVIPVKDENRVYLSYSRTYTKEYKNDKGDDEEKLLFDAAGIIMYDAKENAVEGVRLEAPIDNIIINKSNRVVLSVISNKEVDDEGVVSESELTVTEVDCLLAGYPMEIDSIPTVISNGYAGKLIKTANRFYIEGANYKIPATVMAALDGYDTIVDITKVDYSTRVALADDNINVKTLVITSTKDRGLIITVED